MGQSRLAKRKMGVALKPLEKKKTKYRLRKIFFAGVIVLFLLITGFYFLSPKEWDGVSKFSVAKQNGDGSVDVDIFDPINSTFTIIKLPADTQVQASNRLGTWRLGSISRLGEYKKIEKDFLKDTLIKSFGFPIDKQTDSTESNFYFVDRIRLILFKLQVGEGGRSTVDLTKTNLLEKGRLADGSSGYVISDAIPTDIKSYFVGDNKNTLNVNIKNEIAGKASAYMVSKVLDALGLNVVSIQDADEDNSLDCVVNGLARDVVIKVSRIFGCDSKFVAASNNFDLEISIGKIFRDRF